MHIRSRERGTKGREVKVKDRREEESRTDDGRRGRSYFSEGRGDVERRKGEEDRGW